MIATPFPILVSNPAGTHACLSNRAGLNRFHEPQIRCNRFKLVG